MAEHRSSIEIQASPDTVFDHLVTEAGMTSWMGTFARLDARPGGEFAVDIAGHAVRGEYIAVERPGWSSRGAWRAATSYHRVPRPSSSC